MTIITAPHPTLRQTAAPVGEVSRPVRSLLVELGDTLMNQTNPRGVGLAAPQVDHSTRVFTTYLPFKDCLDWEHSTLPTELKQPVNLNHSRLLTYINPRLTAHSQHHTLGGTEDQPVLEGCLSIPKLYGPVPRWEWVQVEFEVLAADNISWQTFSWRAHDYFARVIQHELDHLNGILFTDYSLKYDLPVYHEDPETEKLVELENRSILEVF
jgi:peptide deformylase